MKTSRKGKLFQVKTNSTQVQLHYGSGTAKCCYICARQMLCVHSPDGSTFMCEMTSWPPS